jgi:hypothetical protein
VLHFLVSTSFLRQARLSPSFTSAAPGQKRYLAGYWIIAGAKRHLICRACSCAIQTTRKILALISSGGFPSTTTLLALS